MPDDSSNPKLLFALASALGLALLVIAFLVGRESGRSAGAPQLVAPFPNIPLLAPQAQPEDQSDESRAVDPWQQRDEEYANTDARWEPVDGIDERPDGSIVLSNTRHAVEAKLDPADPRAAGPSPPGDNSRTAVTSYFTKVDAIRSNAGAGDPNTFAMGLIKAGMGGATSGFDQLIVDTDRMAQELKSLTPPPSCQPYHAASLGALEESLGMLKSMKTAIAARDIQALLAIAQQATVLQNKAEMLKDLQEQLGHAPR
jgi:hypothetical protein